MLLVHRETRLTYKVVSEEYDGGICIYATPAGDVGHSFVMHYETLEELNDEWEDAD